MDPILAAVLIAWLICRRAWNRDEETDTPAARGRQTGPAPSRAAQRAPRYGFFPFLRDNWRDYWGRRYDALAAARNAQPTGKRTKVRLRDRLDAALEDLDQRWANRTAGRDPDEDPPPIPAPEPDEDAPPPDRPKFKIIPGGKPDDPPAKPEPKPQHTDKADEPEPVAPTEPPTDTPNDDTPPPSDPKEHTNVDADAGQAIRAALTRTTTIANALAEQLAGFALGLNEGGQQWAGDGMNKETVALIAEAAGQARAAAAAMADAAATLQKASTSW